jgi:hypothetical protein
MNVTIALQFYWRERLPAWPQTNRDTFPEPLAIDFSRLLCKTGYFKMVYLENTL